MIGGYKYDSVSNYIKCKWTIYVQWKTIRLKNRKVYATYKKDNLNIRQRELKSQRL